jgi:hypothetical protein
LPRCGPRRCGSGSQSCIPTSRPVRWVWSDTSRRRHGTDAGHRTRYLGCCQHVRYFKPTALPLCARGFSALPRRVSRLSPSSERPSEAISRASMPPPSSRALL